MLKSDSSYGWGRMASRAFSNAATGIANPVVGERSAVARGQNAHPGESNSRLETNLAGRPHTA